MVNNLLTVKCGVPRASALKEWSSRQETLRNQI